MLLGTVAIGDRLIESEIRTRASAYGFTAEVLWAEMDLLRRTVGEMRRGLADGESVAYLLGVTKPELRKTRVADPEVVRDLVHDGVADDRGLAPGRRGDPLDRSAKDADAVG